MSSAPRLYILDTNIVVHYSRGKTVGQQIERDYSLLTTAYRPLICVVTLGEALAFARKRAWGQSKISGLQNLLSQFVTVDINHPQIIETYAEFDCHSQSVGRKMGKNDLWIAAAARVTSANLITTDADFDHLSRTHLSIFKIDALTGMTI
jgi:predicted nucleic acid-binding protein